MSGAGAQGGKVLVLGDDTRSFLAIVRSLGRQGVAVHAAPANFAAPALRSRHIAAIHRLPPYMGDGAEWLAAVEALLVAERFEMVIPCDETTLLPFWHHRARLELLSRIGIPGDRAIEVLFDKHATRELAASLGVAVAPGRLPRPDDTPEGLLAELGRPVVVKPRRSYTEGRLHSRAKVQVAGDAAALAQALARLDPEETLLEAFRPGHGAGVSVLAHEGRVLQAFEHHRVRETGSGSFYRVSAPVTPALGAACAAMVEAVGYTGVAMFEFRLGDTAQDWVLLEVNARPWGSLPLPVGIGVDFPYRWYRLVVHGEETAPVVYPAGRYGRNLLPDIRGILAEAKEHDGGAASRAWLVLRRFAEMARVLTGRERHDVLVADDPRPGLVELREAAALVLERVATWLPGAARRRRQRALAALARARAAAHAARAPLRVVFVCQGNICRSPFAAAQLRARLEEGNDVEVASFGMMPRPGRTTPELGLAAAAARGIDLTPHRSAWFSPEEAARAGVVLVFDEINRQALHDRYPALAAPVLFLSDFADPPLPRIDDPVDGDRAVFDAAYAEIARAVDGLAAELRR